MSAPVRTGRSWPTRLAWFLLLWAGGVASVGLAAAALKIWLSP